MRLATCSNILVPDLYILLWVPCCCWLLKCWCPLELWPWLYSFLSPCRKNGSALMVPTALLHSYLVPDKTSISTLLPDKCLYLYVLWTCPTYYIFLLHHHPVAFEGPACGASLFIFHNQLRYRFCSVSVFLLYLPALSCC
jgi:hypothetical protein